MRWKWAWLELRESGSGIFSREIGTHCVFCVASAAQEKFNAFQLREREGLGFYRREEGGVKRGGGSAEGEGVRGGGIF